jgi:ADP-heptose:LPS heptosyltransferase
MRFLIVKPSSLGDIVHTLPVASIIKKKIQPLI